MWIILKGGITVETSKAIDDKKLEYARNVFSMEDNKGLEESLMEIYKGEKVRKTVRNQIDFEKLEDDIYKFTYNSSTRVLELAKNLEPEIQLSNKVTEFKVSPLDYRSTDKKGNFNNDIDFIRSFIWNINCKLIDKLSRELYNIYKLKQSNKKNSYILWIWQRVSTGNLKFPTMSDFDIPQL